MKLNDLKIITTDWQQNQNELAKIRLAVFVKEQQVPLELELDEHDSLATHFLAVAGDTHQPIGTARILENGHIGRMAVLLPFRHQSVGTALLRATIDFASSRALPAVFLNAQVSAKGFYENAGFEQQGEVFLDAGIPHVRMRMMLADKKVSSLS